MIGRVVSNKMEKSAVVLLEFSVKHPLYQKAFKRSKKYLVDDSIGVKVGDIVEFIKIRPISKNKHWKITKVLGQNFAEIAQVQLKAQAEKQIEEVMPDEKEEIANIDEENVGTKLGEKEVVGDFAEKSKSAKIKSKSSKK